MIKKLLVAMLLFASPILASTAGAFGDESFISNAPLLGRVLWVSSTSTTKYGYAQGSYTLPYDTIEHCLARASVVTGDMIMVKPYHTESLTETLTISKNGIKIIGLGTDSSRPVITNFTGVTNCIDVTGGDVEISGLKIVAGVDAQQRLISSRGAGLILKDNYFYASSAIQPLTFVSSNVKCVIQGNRFESDTAGVVNCITLIGTPDRVRIFNNDIIGDFSTAGIESVGAATSLQIFNNLINNASSADVAVKLATNSTGMIRDNRIQVNGTVYTAAIANASASFMENFVATGSTLGGWRNTPYYR